MKELEVLLLCQGRLQRISGNFGLELSDMLENNNVGFQWIYSHRVVVEVVHPSPKVLIYQAS